MDALAGILDDLYDPAELDDFEPFPQPAPPFETPRERAARERRDAADRQRRSRERRKERDEERERALLARESEVLQRERELDMRALDTAVVDALRTVIRNAGLRDSIRTQDDLKAATVSLHSIMGEVLYAEVTDGGRDRGETVRELNTRLFR